MFVPNNEIKSISVFYNYEYWLKHFNIQAMMELSKPIGEPKKEERIVKVNKTC